MKTIRKALLRTLLALLLVLVVLLLTINLPFDFYAHETAENDYSNWMGETLIGTEKVIDVAMLGAHDAFTSDINFFSRTDVLSANSIQTGITGELIRGFSVKQSKTQVSDVTTLLSAGVRYFDIRLTYNDAEAAWYTSHTYFSTLFSDVLAEMDTFLDEHPGEILLLDIQHVWGIDYAAPLENDRAFGEIRGLFADSGVLAHAYAQGTKTLADVTVADVTASQSAAGVLIFTKLANEDNAFWSYGASIRSLWANSDSPEIVYSMLSTETDDILAGTARTGNQMGTIPEAVDARQGIRVLQGVLTMQMGGDGIPTAILEWSLLARARAFNPELIAQADFPAWLDAMPVLMVDYADSNYADFLDTAMDLILSANQNG